MLRSLEQNSGGGTYLREDAGRQRTPCNRAEDDFATPRKKADF